VSGSFISWKIRCAVFGSIKSWVSIRSDVSGQGVESQDAGDGASCQELVVRSLIGGGEHDPRGPAPHECRDRRAVRRKPALLDHVSSAGSGRGAVAGRSSARHATVAVPAATARHSGE